MGAFYWPYNILEAEPVALWVSKARAVRPFAEREINTVLVRRLKDINMSGTMTSINVLIIKVVNG